MDTRQQIYTFIEQMITDPLQRQNTAAVVRQVLKYIVQNAANLADDDWAQVVFWNTLQKSKDEGKTIQQAIDEAIQGVLHYRGKYPSLEALETALPEANEGDYAHVDAGEGSDIVEYIWDASDSVWVIQKGVTPEFTLAGKPAISDTDPLADADQFGVQKADGSWWGLSWAKLKELVGATSGEATLEAASAVLAFTNPFGHIRTTALTGAQTFTKSGTTLGSTVVQAYTATGSGALTFDFAHTILNSDFTSGGVLAAGEYKLFFSNWGDTVAVSIATVGSGVEPTPNTAPTITLLGANPMTLTVGDTYAEPGATATDSEDGDLSASIVITGTVDTTTAGTYTRYYNVSDSEGLAATEVTRTVQVNAAGATQLNTPGSFTATANGETQINLTWTDTNS